DTVRFARQPVPGLRIYFCQHLTPDYIWDKSVMQHKNGARSLDEIVIRAPDPHTVADTLAVLVGGQAQVLGDGRHVVVLPNLRLVIVPDAGLAEAVIEQAVLGYRDGSARRFNPPL